MVANDYVIVGEYKMYLLKREVKFDRGRLILVHLERKTETELFNFQTLTPAWAFTEVMQHF